MNIFMVCSSTFKGLNDKCCARCTCKNEAFEKMGQRKQQGVAIILVLLIVAIATSLAAYIGTQQNLWQRQVESQFERGQTRQLAAAGINYARAIMFDDELNNKPVNVDHPLEPWTLELPALPIENGEIKGVIEDRQGRFNLNNVLVDIKQFEDLLTVLGLPVDLAANLFDWMTAVNAQPSVGGAKDEYYLALPQPYRTSGKPLIELGELVKIKGFDKRIIERLDKYVSVLPIIPGQTRTKINVNFAKDEVLMAVIGMSAQDVQKVKSELRISYFKDVADFKSRVKRKDLNINDDYIAVQSDYFWVTGIATVRQAKVEIQALLERVPNSGKWPTVKWQSVQ